MKKFIGIISILIGIFTTICAFSYTLRPLALIILSLIGIVISIFTMKKSEQKVISYIGLALNIIPLAFVAAIYLFLA